VTAPAGEGLEGVVGGAAAEGGVAVLLPVTLMASF